MSFMEKICTETFLKIETENLKGVWGIPSIGTAFFWGAAEGNIVLNVGDLSKYRIYPGLRVDLESLLWKVRIWLGAKHGKTRGSCCIWEATLVLNLDYKPSFQTSWILRLLSAQCEAQFSVLLWNPCVGKLLGSSSPLYLSVKVILIQNVFWYPRKEGEWPRVWLYFFTNSWLQFWST